MAEEKITIVDLRKGVARHASLPEEQVGRFFSVLFPEIIAGIKKDKSVRISGLGTFKLVWIEPRKSVNVHTNEPIMLDGYNKLTFIPESFLREQINEPYADLDKLEVDANGVPTSPRSMRQGEDPMKRLGEQAKEIQDLLADIGQAIDEGTDGMAVMHEPLEEETSNEIATTTIEEAEIAVEAGGQEIETPTVEKDAKIDAESEEIETELPSEQAEETATAEENVSTEEIASAETYTTEESRSNLDFPIPITSTKEEEEETTPLQPKKDLWWLWVIIGTVVVLLGLGTVGYFFLQEKIEDWANKLNGKTELVENTTNEIIAAQDNIISTNDSIGLSSVDSIELPQQTAENVSCSTTENEAIAKTKASVFEVREYTEFIATEEVKEGSRLTWISKRYYGRKDFWVYIYEANKDAIADPERIKVGTKLRIPSLPQELTNWDDPQAVDLAKRLHNEYVKK